MSIQPGEARYWAGLVSACVTALIGVVAVPHPFDKILIGIGVVAGVIASYNITPAAKLPPKE